MIHYVYYACVMNLIKMNKRETKFEKTFITYCCYFCVCVCVYVCNVTDEVLIDSLLNSSDIRVKQYIKIIKP